MTLPTTLTAPTPDAGLQLARQFASALAADWPAGGGLMADHLKSLPGLPAPSIVTAIYFHAIAHANGGWASASNRTPLG